MSCSGLVYLLHVCLAHVSCGTMCLACLFTVLPVGDISCSYVLPTSHVVCLVVCLAGMSCVSILRIFEFVHHVPMSCCFSLICLACMSCVYVLHVRSTSCMLFICLACMSCLFPCSMSCVYVMRVCLACQYLESLCLCIMHVCLAKSAMYVLRARHVYLAVQFHICHACMSCVCVSSHRKKYG